MSNDSEIQDIFDHPFRDNLNMDIWTTLELDFSLGEEYWFPSNEVKFGKIAESEIGLSNELDEVVFPLSSSPDYDLTVDPDCEQLIFTETSETLDSTGSSFVLENPSEVIPTFLLTPVSENVPTSKTQSVKNIRNSLLDSHSYPPLILTDEERRMLEKEGIVLPSHYPLTKQEERDLKRIRRKIRNKISAQDSRKRKRVYLDTLEERVKECKDENMALKKRVLSLEAENTTLLKQLQQLKALVVKKVKSSVAERDSSTVAQPVTCMLVLLLSFGLFLAPNLKLDSEKRLSLPGQVSYNSPTEKTTGFVRRNLLQQFIEEDHIEDSYPANPFVDFYLSGNGNFCFPIHAPAAKRTVHESFHQQIQKNWSSFAIILDDLDVGGVGRRGRNSHFLPAEDF